MTDPTVCSHIWPGDLSDDAACLNCDLPYEEYAEYDAEEPVE